MTSDQEDKLGMFLKCYLFLINNAVALAINSAFAALAIALDAKISAIVDADSTATRNLSGVTTSKAQARSSLETQILMVAAACRGYFTTFLDEVKKALVRLTKTQVEDLRDAELLTKSDQVLDVALPIKTLLAPWGVAEADVTAVTTLTATYRVWLQKPRSEQIVSEVAHDTVAWLYSDVDKLLTDGDDQFAVMEYTNNPMYLGWRLSHSIDNSGGGSDSSGYTVQNYTVPAAGFVNFYSGDLGTGKALYIRVIGGNGIIACTTDAATTPCTAGTGFTAQPGTTYTQTIAEMGLDTTKTNLQFTNNGTQAVTVRAGFAV